VLRSARQAGQDVERHWDWGSDFKLAEQTFDVQEFPFAFLEAFGNKPTTIKRLRSGASNRSDLGGVLQTNSIHLAACLPGDVTKTLAALKASPATAKAKARFILATDGTDFEAEDLDTGETVACAYRDVPDHFGFFLPLAGITTVKQVRESSFDIRATRPSEQSLRRASEGQPRASISAAGSETILSGWRNCSNSTPKWRQGGKRARSGSRSVPGIEIASDSPAAVLNSMT
jgi:hypothetical protein